MEYKKHKVVMLPTDEASLLHALRKDRTSFELKCEGVIPIKRDTPAHNQHLYILSDEEIKLNEYYCAHGKRILSSSIHKANTERLVDLVNNANPNLASKIIASTDPALELPGLSPEFLKQYCEAGGMDEVRVKYYQPNFPHDQIYSKLFVLDNIINIRPVVERTYTKAEVLDMIETGLFYKKIEVFYYPDGGFDYVTGLKEVIDNYKK